MRGGFDGEARERAGLGSITASPITDCEEFVGNLLGACTGWANEEEVWPIGPVAEGERGAGCDFGADAARIAERDGEPAQ
ncbi:MAG: hypothetical protein ACREMQ_19020 [Longimicrobiales bacterium]